MQRTSWCRRKIGRLEVRTVGPQERDECFDNQPWFICNLVTWVYLTLATERSGTSANRACSTTSRLCCVSGHDRWPCETSQRDILIGWWAGAFRFWPSGAWPTRLYVAQPSTCNLARRRWRNCCFALANLERSCLEYFARIYFWQWQLPMDPTANRPYIYRMWQPSREVCHSVFSLLLFASSSHHKQLTFRGKTNSERPQNDNCSFCIALHSSLLHLGLNSNMFKFAVDMPPPSSIGILEEVGFDSYTQRSALEGYSTG